jgi:DNA primase
MNTNQLLSYYSRSDISHALLEHSRDREVAGAFRSGGYDSRPNTLHYKTDIIQLVKKGVVSFHFSVEHWKFPMQLNSGNYNENRKGWDIVIDMDSTIGIPKAQTTALEIINFLKKYNIKNYGIKFSGSRGFHISLSWNMFPDELDFEPLAKRYPDVPQIIVSFIRKGIKEKLSKAFNSSEPFQIVDVEKNWSNRHMFRAPFSLNEKTWLVSLPLSEHQLKNFTTDLAKPFNVKTEESFFKGEKNEAQDLLREAMDWHASTKTYEEPKPARRVNKQKILQTAFPPCIRLILSGLKDGQNRSCFTLINFLKTCNWTHEEIESAVKEWNTKNNPPLRESVLLGQLRYHFNRPNSPPANCENDLYYKSFGICQPDEICRTIKNPVGYAVKKWTKLKPEKPVYKCSRCNKAFDNMKSLNRHIGRMHG